MRKKGGEIRKQSVLRLALQRGFAGRVWLQGKKRRTPFWNAGFDNAADAPARQNPAALFSHGTARSKHSAFFV